MAAGASWLVPGRVAAPFQNSLATAEFTRLTDFPGAERDATISPDVAFRSDRDGPFDVLLGQTTTRQFVNLTKGTEDDLGLPVRSQGFSSDGSEVWLSGGVDRRLRLISLIEIVSDLLMCRDHLRASSVSPLPRPGDSAERQCYETKRPDESSKPAGCCRPRAVGAGRSGERPAAVFQHAHECPARKVRRRSIVGHGGQAEPRSSTAARWRSTS
jgi:hypothetical protein